MGSFFICFLHLIKMPFKAILDTFTRWTFLRVKLVFECDFEIFLSLDFGTYALWAEALVQAHFRAPGINSFFQSKSESKGLGIS